MDETVVQIDDEQFLLYAAVEPATDHALHVRHSPGWTTALVEIFGVGSREKHDVAGALFLVDGAPWIQTTRARHGLRFSTKHVETGTLSDVFTSG